MPKNSLPNRLEFAVIWFLACTSPDSFDTGPDSAATSAPPPVVQATFDLRNAQNGNGRSDIELTDGETTTTTDGDGLADLDVLADASFAVAATGGAMLPHHLHGHAGDSPFTYISFTATGTQTTQVLSYLGATWDEETGIVVVGIDTPDLAPVSGAQATIDADSDLAFVFGGSLPETGNTLVDGGSSVVSFVNVTPGDVAVSVTPPGTESCAVFPSRTQADATIQVQAGAVSVVVFTCE